MLMNNAEDGVGCAFVPPPQKPRVNLLL